MAITNEQIENAKKKQHAAAHDTRSTIRLVAGPGTGKSRAIVERVFWLLSKGVPPRSIYVVSFTRASSRDLQRRIRGFCAKHGQPNGEKVSVSTLHSLALKALRLKKLLETNPVVLDQWELKNIFDDEFAVYSGYNKGRCKELREIYETSLATNIKSLASHRLPQLPTDEERTQFTSFHQSRTITYRCVLPGEIVRKCVDEWDAGTLNPATLLRARHLIVDEFQDLNETDLKFVHCFIENGVTTFVAGDDDQSIYSFRFASPAGIQGFTTKYKGSGRHELNDCFRCTTSIVNIANNLIEKYSPRSRIPKSLNSLYQNANPPNPGIFHRWRFTSAYTEAEAITQSCKALIDTKKVPPRDIMILLGNHDVLFGTLRDKLNKENVEFEPPRQSGFIDKPMGRFIMGLIRAVCDPNDYIAHRLLLGLPPNVGPVRCNNIVEGVLRNQLNYGEIFYGIFMPPEDTFDPASTRALARANNICTQITDWTPDDTRIQREEDIVKIITNTFGDTIKEIWANETEHLPEEMSLSELRDYFWADTDEQQERLLKSVYERLKQPLPEDGLLPPKVRMMTMHGAKGLDAKIVFIPGLEDGVLPREKQKPYPGAVQEAARTLYVSITRARATCIISYSEGRYLYGEWRDRTRSDFIPKLGGTFFLRKAGLTNHEVEQILQAIGTL